MFACKNAEAIEKIVKSIEMHQVHCFTKVAIDSLPIKIKLAN